MNGFQSQINDYIDEVEKCTNPYRQNLEEEKKKIASISEKVSSLRNAFNLMENNEDAICFKPMRISNHSLLDSLFKEESHNAFLFGEDREAKRKRLAAERRAEYNAYLEKKEFELQAKRKAHEEMSSSTATTPRSVLESVDYETILAKRKEEELKFRQIHHAEPSLRNGVNDKQTAPDAPSLHEKFPLRENNTKNFKSLSIDESNFEETNKISSLSHNYINPRESRHAPHRPLSSQENYFHRTGGGGEPVRDPFGNLITIRGFRGSSPNLPFPSYNQDYTSNKKSSYREELAKQIEEKKHLAALEKEKALELENKLAQRSEAQRHQMQLEYENELKANNQVKEQEQQKRFRQLEEFQRKEAERRQRSKEARTVESRPQTKENQPVDINRSSSPPIPAVRSKIIFERVTSPCNPQALSAVPVRPESIFSSLAEIRKKIMQDKQNLNRTVEGTYEVMNRRTIHDENDDDYEIGEVSEQFENLKT